MGVASTILIMLAKAGANYAFKKVASKGTEGIIEWVKKRQMKMVLN